jgi:PAS domain S-box-containing protein
MTESKPTKEELQECEKKFVNALRECPLAVTLTSAVDHRYIEVNGTFERISGWHRDEVIGRTPFDIDIWVDPSHRVSFVKQLLSGGIVRNLDVHARLKNREVWIGLGYAALIEINGEACVLSLIEGVTDVKEADQTKQSEVTLSNMTRRLIQAQEEERASVSHELHDHIDGLLLLSMNLDGVRQHFPESASEGNKHIAEAKRQIEDLALNIQNLSHRLHSSKLEYLGLAKAAASLCKELSDEKQVEIQFSSEGMREDLPQDVSLCLFRVLQGTLQNALSHGEQHVEVLLRFGSNEVYLTVRYSGVGFDADDGLNVPRLAIMKERLKLVDGDFSVQSQGKRGTTIHARVPLHAKIDSTERAR